MSLKCWSSDALRHYLNFLPLLAPPSVCQSPKPLAEDMVGRAEGFELFTSWEQAPFFLPSSSLSLPEEQLCNWKLVAGQMLGLVGVWRWRMLELCPRLTCIRRLSSRLFSYPLCTFNSSCWPKFVPQIICGYGQKRESKQGVNLQCLSCSTAFDTVQFLLFHRRLPCLYHHTHRQSLLSSWCAGS